VLKVFKFLREILSASFQSVSILFDLLILN
jgi:hypothetical protein